MKPLVILAGPTAVGKTALSIKLAKKINGAVISADSMQVYKHMDIGSAKVMPEEMKGIPHYLIDVCLCSLDFHLHAPVIPVSHPPGKSQLTGLLHRIIPETYTLNATVKINMFSDF